MDYTARSRGRCHAVLAAVVSTSSAIATYTCVVATLACPSSRCTAARSCDAAYKQKCLRDITHYV